MTTPQVNDDRRHRTLTTIWAALLGAILLYAAVGYLVRGAGTTELDEVDAPILLLLAFISLSTAALSFIVKRAMLLKATQEQDALKAQAAVIVGCALAESAALNGLVALLVTGSTYAYLLLALGFVCLLLHKPGRDQLAAAAYKNRSWG